MAHAAGMRFKALQEACGLTDGNLNRHLHALAETGIIELARETGNGRRATIVRITERGRERFLAYIDELEAVVRTVNASEPQRALAPNGLRMATSS
jgi:DNA-binding MarR family transcriptional regulator